MRQEHSPRQDPAEPAGGDPALEDRLAEAEEALNAIRQGLVDGLVVEGPNGQPSVYTLGGADEPYRLMVEQMQEGAVTLDHEGDVLYCNRRFAELLKITPQRAVGSEIWPFVAPRHHELLRGACLSQELTLVAADGEDVPVLVSSSELTIDDQPGLCMVVTDLRQLKQAEETLQAEALARSIIEHATEAMVVCDTEGTVTHASRRAELLVGQSLVGQAFTAAIPLRPAVLRQGAATGGEALDAAACEDAALRGETIRGAEFECERSGQDAQVSLLLSAGPLRASGGSGPPVGYVVTLTDITERKEAEQRQDLLMSELDHRAKNLLAVVQATTNLMRAETVEDFREGLEGRVHALARTHTLLAQSRWEGVLLYQLIAEELAPYREGDGSRMCMEGPPVRLSAAASQDLAMALHELATNAAKHGALSIPGGRLEVRWCFPQAQDGPLELVWREEGERPVAPPQRRGFGSTVIAQSIRHQLEGSVELDWQPAGLVCRMRIPAEHLQPLPATGAARLDSAEDRQRADRATERPALILVVEDNVLVALEIEQMLAELGYRVLGPAGSLNAALKLARESEVEAAILDIDLKGEKVFPVADLLAGRGLPFLFATGYEREAVVEDRYRHTPVLGKPYRAHEISAHLDRLLRREGQPITASD